MEKIVDKVKRLEELLMEAVLRGLHPVASRLASERELAEQYSVSRVTARKALRSLAEKGILSCRETVGYFVTSEALKLLAELKRHHDDAPKVGVIFQPKRYGNALMSFFFRCLEESCAPEIKVLAYFHSYLKPEFYKRDELAAVIVEDSFVEEDIQKIADSGVEVIVFNRETKNFNFATVDNDLAGSMMIERLAHAGHRHILYPTLTNLPEDNEFTRRHRGATAAAEKLGVSLSCPRLTPHSEIYHPAQFARFFTAPHAVTAIAAFQNLLAVNFIEFLESQGLRIPQDISLIGVDENDFNAALPTPLTVIRHPFELMGEDISEFLKPLVKGGKKVLQRKYAPILVERQSIRTIF